MKLYFFWHLSCTMSWTQFHSFEFLLTIEVTLEDERNDTQPHPLEFYKDLNGFELCTWNCSGAPFFMHNVLFIKWIYLFTIYIYIYKLYIVPFKAIESCYRCIYIHTSVYLWFIRVPNRMEKKGKWYQEASRPTHFQVLLILEEKKENKIVYIQNPRSYFPWKKAGARCTNTFYIGKFLFIIFTQYRGKLQIAPLILFKIYFRAIKKFLQWKI